MNLFVMISTRHSLPYSWEALKTFFEETPLRPEDRFVLIDNDGSYTPDGRSPTAPVEVIVNQKALGFAENGNQAIELARKSGAALFLLNNDLIFTPGWLEPLMVSNPSIISPLSNRELNCVLGDFRCGTSMTIEEYRGKEALVRELAHKQRKAISGYGKMLVVPFFAVKIPRIIYEAVGGFDESFGKGGAEDYDYCLRAYELGFEAMYAHTSYLIHFGGRSSWAGAETKPEQLERERIFFEAFERKWGRALRELIFTDRTDLLDRYPELAARAGRGELKELIADVRRMESLA